MGQSETLQKYTMAQHFGTLTYKSSVMSLVNISRMIGQSGPRLHRRCATREQTQPCTIPSENASL